MATQSEQNSNRQIRSDKKPPTQELIDAGITEFPKYVTWNDKDKKFVIDCHPKLIQDIKDGIRKKAIMNGTKSTKLTIQEKYKDILARLNELNNQIKDNFNDILKEQKLNYDNIIICIQKSFPPVLFQFRILIFQIKKLFLKIGKSIVG